MVPEIYSAGWAGASHVNSWTSARLGGSSEGEFSSLNLGTHVGDDLVRVTQNRGLVKSQLRLHNEPVWLDQVHSERVLTIASYEEYASLHPVIQADASFTNQPNICLAVMVADCLPVLLASSDGTEIAAVHAGWQGLAQGIIAEALACFDSDDVAAYLGPCIGPCHYEVDERVKSQFSNESAFELSVNPERWMFNLKAEAGRQLSELNVRRVTTDQTCTHCSGGHFSFRRDGVTGRFASFIWRSQ